MPSLTKLHRLTAQFGQPANLFSGLRVADAFCPDNVILFRRTSTAAFVPSGTSTNYHHRFELVVVLKQSGQARIDDSSWQLQPGECILIFPHQFHHYMDVQQGAIDWLFVTFESAIEKPVLPLRNQPRQLTDASVELLERIAAAYFAPEPDALGVSWHLARLLQILVQSPVLPESRRSAGTTDDSRSVLMQQINDYLKKNLRKAPTLETIAAELGYSATYVRSIFSDKIGISLGAYIRESRLAEASRLLLTTDQSIQEIAENTGFHSLSAFSRAFSSNFGLSPTAYAEQFRKG